MSYTFKSLGIYWYHFLRWINCKILKTYPLIWDCARCNDCGRNVHDFGVPDNFWMNVVEDENKVLCYDCFCDRSDFKYGLKYRMDFIEKWNCPNNKET